MKTSGWLSRAVTQTQITHRGRLWLYAVSVLVMLFLVVPTLIVVPMSFSASQHLEFPPREWSLRWYANDVGSASWMQATRTSLLAGVFTALLAAPLGTMAAYGLHASRWRFAAGTTMLLLTPMVVPVVMMVVGSALRSFDMNQERVARSLGASRVRAFCLVTLPQIGFSVVTAAVLAFLTSFDEIIVSLVVSDGDPSTLTRNMFTSLRDQVDPTIAAISTLIIAVTSLLLAFTQFIGKKS